MPQIPELLLLDFDGVLADLDVRIRRDALATMTGQPAEQVARALAARRALPEEDSADDLHLAAFVRALGQPLAPAQWHAARMQATVPRRDCLALLRQAGTRVPLAVLSNNPAALAAPIARLLGLPAARVLTSGALGLRKPDPACFLAAVGQLDARPERTLFVDNLFRNVRGARQAGLMADTAHHAQSLRRLLRRFALLR